jgi:hypothetical protein
LPDSHFHTVEYSRVFFYRNPPRHFCEQPLPSHHPQPGAPPRRSLRSHPPAAARARLPRCPFSLTAPPPPPSFLSAAAPPCSSSSAAAAARPHGIQIRRGRACPQKGRGGGGHDPGQPRERGPLTTAASTDDFCVLQLLRAPQSKPMPPSLPPSPSKSFHTF